MARAMSTSEAPTVDGQQDPPANETGTPGGAGPLLRAIALQRPVAELLRLVALLNAADRPAHALEILTTAATMRPVGDVAALVPGLVGPQAANVLHAAVAQRPIEDLAELVAQLHAPEEPAPAAVPHRWSLLR